ncbi:hypothetical protein L6R46_19270 [Myxococcota bacterium]|nr:hypothetical protein [Myxococcota bacterium]
MKERRVQPGQERAPEAGPDTQRPDLAAPDLRQATLSQQTAAMMQAGYGNQLVAELTNLASHGGDGGDAGGGGADGHSAGGYAWWGKDPEGALQVEETLTATLRDSGAGLSHGGPPADADAPPPRRRGATATANGGELGDERAVPLRSRISLQATSRAARLGRDQRISGITLELPAQGEPLIRRGEDGFSVQVTLKLTLRWSLREPDAWDLADADAPALTSATWAEAADDLRPVPGPLGPTPPLRRWWSRALAEQELKLLLDAATEESRRGLRALTRWLNTQSAASEDEVRRRLDEALQRLGRHLSAQLADPELVIDARQRMAPVYAGRAAAITARGEAGAYPTPSPLPTPERRGARFGGLMGALLGLLVGGGLLWDAQSAAMGAALGAFGGALAGALGERDRRSPR